jgi:hypothetical protein
MYAEHDFPVLCKLKAEYCTGGTRKRNTRTVQQAGKHPKQDDKRIGPSKGSKKIATPCWTVVFLADGRCGVVRKWRTLYVFIYAICVVVGNHSTAVYVCVWKVLSVCVWKKWCGREILYGLYRAYTKEWCGFNSVHYKNCTILFVYALYTVIQYIKSFSSRFLPSVLFFLLEDHIAGVHRFFKNQVLTSKF